MKVSPSELEMNGLLLPPPLTGAIYSRAPCKLFPSFFVSIPRPATLQMGGGKWDGRRRAPIPWPGRAGWGDTYVWGSPRDMPGGRGWAWAWKKTRFLFLD